MNLREISRPVTAKSLNESLAKRFGKRINLENFTLDQLQDARNNLRTKMSQVETTESFSTVHQESYQKNKLFLDVLNAEIAEREHISSSTPIKEGAEDKAEIVMAAKDMVDKLTSWMEDTAEMQTESMLELADAIRDEMGTEQSETFSNSIKPALEGLYNSMEETRKVLTQGVTTLTGEGEMQEPMGADSDTDLDTDASTEPSSNMDSDSVDTDLDLDIDDDFGADAAADGDDEPAGREKRESRSYGKSKKK
jgi:hypothetical protein